MKSIYVDKDIPRMLLVKAAKPLWPGIVFSPLSPARFRDLGDAPLPGPRWVRVRNRQCGICPTDLALLFVDADPKIGPAALPGLSRFYLGHEVVGEVVETGAAVARFRAGDRVLMQKRFQGPNCGSQEIDPPCGFCADGEYALCENASVGRGARGAGGGFSDGYTAHELDLFPVPAELDDDQATMVEPLAVGVHAALRRLPAAGERALVVGSGTVGLNVLQAVRALAPGAQVTVLARHRHQAEAAQRLGAHEVLTGEDGYRATARITGAKLYAGALGVRMLLGGFDVVYDCVGSAATLRDSLRWARARGAVVLAGIKLAPMRVDLTPVWFQEVALLGVGSHGVDCLNGARTETFALAADLLRAGKLTADGLITHRFPLADWRAAIRTARDKRTGSIKVAFTFA